MSFEPYRLETLATRVVHPDDLTRGDTREIAAALRELARRILCETPSPEPYPDWITRTNRED